jgi:hypothetical protein
MANPLKNLAISREVDYNKYNCIVAFPYETIK